MNMINYDPYRMLDRFNEINRLFESAFPNRGREGEGPVAACDWTPAVDIKEEDNRYLIHADVPGIKPEDIDVSLEDGVLTIKGERKHESKEEKEGYKRIERVRGTFFRRFTLPDTANQDAVTAKCNDGVLEVVIEKQERATPKKITVTK